MMLPNSIDGAFPSHVLTDRETGEWWMCQSRELAEYQARDRGLTDFKITLMAVI